MNENTLDDLATKAPTLTLDPFAGNEERGSELVLETAPTQQEVIMSDTTLTLEEQQMIDDFSQKIDLTNSNVVLQYGAGVQKKMADFSENTLNNVKTKDLGEVGQLLTGVVTELKNFDEEEAKGLFGKLKKQTNKIQVMRAKYDKAEFNINKICQVMEGHQVNLLKDIALLDKMYELNLNYFKELSMYVLAGKKKLADFKETDLKAAMELAQSSGRPEDAQAARDLDGLANRFEKKIHDLELTKTIAMQTAPQIRLIQGNNTVLVEKIQSTLVNTIPLWKSQMVLALGVEHSSQAAAAQRQVTDMTNELLRKNAATLKTATIETAKESERGIVDMETLKITNASLISTLDEVLKIQQDGRLKRQEAEGEIRRIEGELKQKLLQISQ
ncbi:MAG: toxic anion resistance protein [Defluviitaleaceae bacterium]|nr:toxic anion resistance protein [Defluviitaleaceae bacterium]